MDHITTSFGRRRLPRGMVAKQVAVRDIEGKVAHKSKTFRSIAEAKDEFGMSDRLLVVLNEMLTCLPETAGNLVVFLPTGGQCARMVWPDPRSAGTSWRW